MLCVPTGKLDVVRVAWPTPSRVPVPREVAPSKNCTVPVGVLPPKALTRPFQSRMTLVPPTAACTVAVKVTEAPTVDGLRLEASVVVVVAGVAGVTFTAAEAVPAPTLFTARSLTE